MRNESPNCLPRAVNDHRAVLRLAFIDSLPVLMGYLAMGFAAGVLLAARGNLRLAPLWALLTSTTWITGTMSIACVPAIATRASLGVLALMTLAVNFRYVFYGFSMLRPWRGLPLFHKLYMILMLTDETYALEEASVFHNPRKNLRYCTYISMFNHLYWVSGVTSGAVAVYLLGMAMSPEAVRRYTNGMEFAMVALILAIFTDQIMGFLRHEG